MKDIKLKVEGMTCNHCVMTVKRAVMSVEGVKEAEVSLAHGTVSIKAEEGIDEENIKKAIEQAGYRVAG